MSWEVASKGEAPVQGQEGAAPPFPIYPAFRLPQVGSGSPVLATTSHLPAGRAGLSSGVGFPMGTGVLSHSPAPPVDRELLPVPKTQGPCGLSQGKELGRGRPCQLCSSPQGVRWSSQRFCFSSSDSS